MRLYLVQYLKIKEKHSWIQNWENYIMHAWIIMLILNKPKVEYQTVKSAKINQPCLAHSKTVTC